MKHLGLWPYFAILGLIVVLGGLMLWSDVSFWLSDEQRSDLAGGLMGGALLGVAVLGAEVALGRQLDRLEEQRRRSAEREGLRLQLGLTLSFRGIDLAAKDLRSFYLHERDFTDANLSLADLRKAMLTGANLTRAAMVMTDLSKASLDGAKLNEAILIKADLGSASLQFVDLTGADLSGANLNGATLAYARLGGENFASADLSDADLNQVRWDPKSQPPTWPEGFAAPENAWDPSYDVEPSPDDQ